MNGGDIRNQTQPAAELQAVGVLVGGRWILRDVNLAIPAGKCCAVIGPNGCGKSTLARVLAGYVWASAGRVRILGETLGETDLHLLRRRVKLVQPNAPVDFDPSMSAGDVVLTGVFGTVVLFDQPTDSDRDLARELMRRMGVGRLAESAFGTLSTGEKMRTLIARAMMVEPALLLLDEPAAGLDPAGRVQFRVLLNALRAQGKALIVSSHILADMGEYCSHIAIMGHGRLLRFGTVQQIAAGLDGDLVEYAIGLSRPVPRIEEELAEIDGLSLVRCDGNNVVVRYSPGRDAATTLLKTLVQRGLPVSSFSAVGANLEAAYLREGIRQVD